MNDKYTYEKIVKRLKQLRKNLKISQNEVADILGKFPSYISKVENGKRRLDVIEFAELLEIYKVDVDEFLRSVREMDEEKDKNSSSSR